MVSAVTTVVLASAVGMIAGPVWAWCALAAVAIALPVIAVRRGHATNRVLRQEVARLQGLAQRRAERSSVLSHEIRTPLTMVKGAGELLAEGTPGPLTDRQREFVTTIVDNCQQMIALAEDFLTDARIESQLFELNAELIDLRSLARSTVRDLRRVHAATILLDSRGAPLDVVVDRGLMRQALWNLVNNAARHGGEGVTITVKLAAGDEDVLCSVSDDGRGMTPEERAELFTPFAVGMSHRPGTGLGMMITERIVELHGGRMFVDTVARRGTTVLFTVPLARS